MAESEEALPIALLHTCIAPKEQVGLSPYEMLYGRPFVYVNDLFLDPEAQTLSNESRGLMNPGVMSWYLDCCGGRKYYSVGALPCGLELSLWGPIFPDFN